MISNSLQEMSGQQGEAIQFTEFQQQLEALTVRGGPLPQEYAEVNRAIRKVGDEIRAGVLDIKVLRAVMKEWAEKHFAGTMQAESIFKKHGYSGDFEIIDDIYRMRIAPESRLRRWDLFFHAQAAPCAVRNRKAYFHRLLAGLEERMPGRKLRVLNIASGPARDLREWFDANPDSRVEVDCIELDPKAIAHATALCARYSDRVTFHQQNALKFVPAEKYDLIWSAGLFDYLTDRLFVRLVRSLMPFVNAGGEVVIGNFSEFNSSRDYMELMGDWYLEHRSEERLRGLAERAGALARLTEVHWEPEGVNLFLHVHA
jgi:extracellular factor (EF) 3-hydroxypalmitic acid methyl ester biosynthesis protein